MECIDGKGYIYRGVMPYEKEANEKSLSLAMRSWKPHADVLDPIIGQRPRLGLWRVTDDLEYDGAVNPDLDDF